MDAEQLIEMLGLAPLPGEGGYYVETYRSEEVIPKEALDARYFGTRNHSTAIYFLVTPDAFSALHRIVSDEVFHFYAGDTAEMLQISPDGSLSVTVIGNDLAKGEKPQVVITRGVWQGCRLKPDGKWALMGTTVSPGFDFSDYEQGDRQSLIKQHPEMADFIKRFTTE